MAVTSGLASEGLVTKEEANAIVYREFGPSSHCARAPAIDRNCRFHVFSTMRGSKLQSMWGRGDSDSVTLLGSGADFHDAIQHARTTPNGKLAIKQAQEGQEFAKKALLSKNELEFATMIEDQAVKEAVEMGANDAAIAVIRQRFAKAKEKINESVSRAAEGSDQGSDNSGDRTDHEGGGDRSQ